MQTIVSDLKFAARMLTKNPGFTLIAGLMLALGIGANLAIFGVTRGVLFDALPVRGADRLIVRQESPWVPVDVFDEWRTATRTCESVAAYTPTEFNLASAADAPEYVAGAAVSSEFLPMLAGNVALGRFFTPEDFQTERSVILSHGLWQRRFGGSTGVLGATVGLDGGDYTIVGVLPAEFRHVPLDGETPELWVPMRFVPVRADGESNYAIVMARLRPAATVEQARAELGGLAARVRARTPRAEQEPHWDITLGFLRDELTRPIRPALLLLHGAAVLVLVIACVNVAGLLLARGTARRGEFVLRAALGATQGHLLRQTLTESLLLAVVGGLAALAVAAGGAETLRSLLPADLAQPSGTRLDGGLLLCALTVTFIAGGTAGLAPALIFKSTGLNQALRSGTRPAGHHRFLKSLVVGEIALALILLIGAGLLGNSLARLLRVDPGFDSNGVLTARVRLPESNYATMEGIEGFYRAAVSRLAASPGVAAVAVSNNLPLSRANSTRQVVTDGNTRPLAADFAVVSDGYFQAVGLPVIRGRSFAAADTRSAPGAVIVDESFARAVWPNADAIGQRIKIGDAASSNPWLTVVGVARDARGSGLGAASRPGIYIPYTQRPDTLTERAVGRRMYLIARTTAAPESLAGIFRESVAQVDARQAVTEIRPLSDVVTDSIAQPRFRAWLLGLMAVTALALAVAGVYGVMSYLVARRTQEIGIRLALGAQRGDALRLVMGQGVRLTGIGLTVGFAGAFALARVMKGMLFGVGETDPGTFAVVGTFLAAAALAACWIPARRATKVDPAVALRSE